MKKSDWHTKDHEYKGFFIWNSSANGKISWQIEPCGNPDSQEFWDKRNAIPELKTLKQIHSWIDKNSQEKIL
jgi:hypothetical protein